MLFLLYNVCQSVLKRELCPRSVQNVLWKSFKKSEIIIKLNCECLKSSSKFHKKKKFQIPVSFFEKYSVAMELLSCFLRMIVIFVGIQGSCRGFDGINNHLLKHLPDRMIVLVTKLDIFQINSNWPKWLPCQNRERILNCFQVADQLVYSCQLFFERSVYEKLWVSYGLLL